MISRAVTIIWLCPVSVLCLLLFFVRTLSSLHPMVDLPLFTSAMFFRSRNYGECSPRASFRGCFLRVEVTRKKSHQTIGQCLLVLASIEDLWETTTYFYFSSPFDSESVAERNCFCRERKAGSAQSLRQSCCAMVWYLAFEIYAGLTVRVGHCATMKLTVSHLGRPTE